MLVILFRPFSFPKWLVVGFSAWLAGAGGCGRGAGYQFSGGSWGDDWGSGRDRSGEFSEIGEFLESGWAKVAAGGCMALVVLGCVLFIAFVLALIWVNSRGKFMFLDNVIHNRARIVEPWNQFRRQGNSLFRFWLIYIGVVVALLALAGIFVALGIALDWFGANDELPTGIRLLLGIGAVGVLASFMLAMAYMTFFLDAFVVPLMHRYELNVVEGWSRFLGLLRAHPWTFLLSGLVVFVLWFGVLLAVVAAGLLTCCLGFVLLLIPYVGTVVLLPISVLYRSYTIEFLAQFDPELLAVPATSHE
jgi:hypothetical protein